MSTLQRLSESAFLFLLQATDRCRDDSRRDEVWMWEYSPQFYVRSAVGRKDSWRALPV